ncbi:MAG: hypothetical protein PVJ61_04360 [Dehalococcoidia bacterium]
MLATVILRHEVKPRHQNTALALSRKKMPETVRLDTPPKRISSLIRKLSI